MMQPNRKALARWMDVDVATAQRLTGWREVGMMFGIVFVVWGLYRLMFRLPVWLEEGVFKALVFGGAVVVGGRRFGWKLKDLGMSGETLFAATYFGLSLGLILGFAGQLGNIVRYGRVELADYQLTSAGMGGLIIMSMVTAFWEQLLFSGFILRAMMTSYKDEWSAVLWTAVLFVVLHLPVLVLVQKLTLLPLLTAAGLLFLLQFGCGVLRLRLGNLAAPVLAQALWGVTIYLFR